jgi:hypothetical protein
MNVVIEHYEYFCLNQLNKLKQLNPTTRFMRVKSYKDDYTVHTTALAG